MYGLLVLSVLGVFSYRAFLREPKPSATHPVGLTARLDKLWEVAQQSVQDRKYLRAERALLTILKVDERNATAYNRLGILYARQREYQDAIECFEIAQSLEPSSSSLHNVGLIYYETSNYQKAAIAFEQALAMESDVPSRYIAYAKVQEKLGNDRKMIEALEKATELEPNPQTLRVLAHAYERTGQHELAEKTHAAIAHMTPEVATPHAPARPPRKVVM